MPAASSSPSKRRARYRARTDEAVVWAPDKSVRVEEHNVVPHGPGHGGRKGQIHGKYAKKRDAEEKPGGAFDKDVPDVLDVKDLRALGGGISTTYRYTDPSGKEWVVKQSAVGMSGMNAELAAQIVNDAMGGFVDMPRTTKRRLRDEFGDEDSEVLVTEFVSDATVARDWHAGDAVPMPGRDLGRTERLDALDARANQVAALDQARYAGKADLDLFDTIIGNNDRHQGNYLVRGDGKTVAIDHDLAFSYGDVKGFRQRDLSPERRAAVQRLKDNEADVRAQFAALGEFGRDPETFQRGVSGSRMADLLFNHVNVQLGLNEAATMEKGKRKRKAYYREVQEPDEPELEEHNVVPHGPGHGGRAARARAQIAAQAQRQADARGLAPGAARPGRTTRIRRGLRAKGVDPAAARAAAPGVAAGQRDVGLRGHTDTLVRGQAAVMLRRGAQGAAAGAALAPQMGPKEGWRTRARNKAAERRKEAAEQKKQAQVDAILKPNPDRAGKWEEVQIPGRRKKEWMRRDELGNIDPARLERAMKTGWATQRARDQRAWRKGEQERLRARRGQDRAERMAERGPGAPNTRRSQTTTALEAELLDGNITNIKNLGGGINTTLKARIGGRDVIVKPLDGAHVGDVRQKLPWGNDHGRERSAYDVNKVLQQHGAGVDMPTVVIRDTPRGRAIVMDFVNPQGRRGSTNQEVAFFDALVGNTDRHGGNIINLPAGRSQQRYVAIDHGLAFPEGSKVAGNYNFLSGFGGSRITSSQRAALPALKTPEMHATLTQNIGKKATDDFYRRVNYMIDNGTMPKTSGWGGMEGYDYSATYTP